MGFRGAVGLVLTGSLLLTACGGAGETSSETRPTIELEDTTAVLAASVDRTNEIGSFHFDMIAEVSVPEVDTAMMIRADGAVDLSRGEIRMTIDMSSMFDAIADEPGAEYFPDLLGDAEAFMIVTPDAAYMKFGALTELTGSAEWVELPLDMASAQAADLGFGLGDPTQILSDLGAGRDVTDLGVETVQGVSTHRYRVTLDGEPFSGASVGDLFSSDMPIDVWIDDRGLIRRMEASYEFGGVAGAFAMEFHSFGEDPNIVIPSGDDVASFDMSDFLG